jgi:hypothetical protein
MAINQLRLILDQNRVLFFQLEHQPELWVFTRLRPWYGEPSWPVAPRHVALGYTAAAAAAAAAAASRLLTRDSRVRDARLLTPDSRLLTRDSRLATRDSLTRDCGSRLRRDCPGLLTRLDSRLATRVLSRLRDS